MIRFRPFRNSDPPALVKLWNQGLPEQGVVRPLRAHELDDHAFGPVYFDRNGLILAESDGRLVGFVHAGFGPDDLDSSAPPFEVSPQLGTIAMLVVDRDADGPEVARGLILEAERYLRSRGAKVLYAGGQFPLNPFYWGLYAGSEGSGILPSHPVVPAALTAMGYEPISTTVMLEYDLAVPDPRDPRAALVRRQTRIDLDEDPLPANWWENVALGDFHPVRFHILTRDGNSELGHATAWDMSWFGRLDGKARIGLLDLAIDVGRRRQGYGRLLVTEILRWAREQGIELVEVETMATNQPALAFYQSLGFLVKDHGVLYRLPAHLLDRSAIS